MLGCGLLEVKANGEVPEGQAVQVMPSAPTYVFAGHSATQL